MFINIYAHHFSSINDPRPTASVSYFLFNALFLIVYAVMEGQPELVEN